ncbi:MAG: hypothetical protein ACOX6E_03725 [Syntrophomonadaceae bacterium]|jgi:hypothetical protein
MPPLLYIILLGAVLLLMLYWVLSTLNPQESKWRVKVPNHNLLSWESAQELFKYLETDEFYLAADDIKLQIAESGQLRVYWRFSPEKWQEILHRLGHKPGDRKLILRLYENDSIRNDGDIPIKMPAGSHDWDTQAKASYYASVGIKEKYNYIAILRSDAIKAD